MSPVRTFALLSVALPIIPLASVSSAQARPTQIVPNPLLAQQPAVGALPVIAPNAIAPNSISVGQAAAWGMVTANEIRPLPGQLDRIPVFNSNSPEMVRTEGILLSTFPPGGMRSPLAHLNYPLQGRFDIFAHHITQLDRPGVVTTLYLGILLHNPGTDTVIVNVPQGATYLSTPDAPFRPLPALIDNPTGFVFSGPGSRVMNHVLRGRRQTLLPSQLLLPPGESRMLISLPLPLPRRGPRVPLPFNPLAELGNGQFPLIEDIPGFGTREPSSNGRSLLAYLDSSGPVYVASLAMYSRIGPEGYERAPTIADWQQLLVNGNLVSPRDNPPSPMEVLNSPGSRFFYSRVSGVSQGSSWSTTLTDPTGGDKLTIAMPGRSISYGISTLHRGTLGTGQVQSAPMLVRYPDTALFSHGNYGVHYDLTLPLYNPSPIPQTVAVMLQTPLKEETLAGNLNFLPTPAPQVFFRGTVRVNYNGDDGTLYSRFVHLVQRRGQRGEPIAILTLQPGQRRQVEVDLLYPPDATPPQVITLSTLQASDLLTRGQP